MGQLSLKSFKKRPVSRANSNETRGMSGLGGVQIEQVKVPFPVLVDRFNIIARSQDALVDKKSFYGFGKIQILFYPFDNIIKFTIAQGTNEQPKLFNLTSFNEIKFILRNDQTELSFPLFTESGDVNLADGQVAFKVEQSKYGQVKKIFQSGINVFYITGRNQTTTSVIYTGLFKPYDDKSNVNDLNLQAGNIKPKMTLDNTEQKNTAIVTRKQINDPPVVPKNPGKGAG